MYFIGGDVGVIDQGGIRYKTYYVIFYTRIVKANIMSFILIAHVFYLYFFCNEYRGDKTSVHKGFTYSHLFLISTLTYMRLLHSLHSMLPWLRSSP